MSIEPLVQFDIELPKLSENQSKVLDLLVEAGKLVVPLYQLQENEDSVGANFYPHDAPKEEIEEAAKTDLDILSSYTVVERVDGKLVATPYHKKYINLLKPIAEKLNEAAKMTDDKDFAKLLELQAEALLDGSYKQVMAFRLQMKPYILDISVGPNDYFDDRLFLKKYSYQAWVGVLDLENTKILTTYKDIILSARRKALSPSKRIENVKVKTQVQHTVLFSGLMARTKFVGMTIPFDDLEAVKKYGSEVILFKHANYARVQEQIIPIFNEIFSKGFKDGFSEKDLIEGSMGYIALHEIVHSFLRYENAFKLEELMVCIEELAATTLGFRVGGSLLLKDLVTTKELESMIIVYLCRNIYLAKNRDANKSMNNYVLGGTIFLNYMLESGALRSSNGLSVPNFTKIFVAIHDLAVILEQLLSTGSKEEAKQFIEKYSGLPKLF